MKASRLSFGRWRKLCLAAGCLLAGWMFPARGGEPIQFSSPDKEVETPARRDTSANLPRRSWRLELPQPEVAPVRPPIVVIDPRLEKLRRERREENRTWPFNEPEMFKDKSEASQEKGQDVFGGAFRAWDERVERVLGKTETDLRRDPSSKPEVTRAIYSDELPFSPGRKSQDRLDATPLKPAEFSKPELLPNNNDSEAAMKALFDPKAAPEKLPLLPGMSLYEMMEAAKASAETFKRQRQARREEAETFNPATLAMEPQSGKGEGTPAFLESVTMAPDQTRALVNPITPLSVNNTLPTKTPLEPILPPGSPGNPALPKLPFEEVTARLQKPAASVPAPETKVRQMEALKLMSRPSVLSFPGSPF
jgi:hypothetical protein